MRCIYIFTFFSDAFQSQGDVVAEETLHDILTDVDANSNGQLELEEFLQVTKILNPHFRLFSLLACRHQVKIVYQYMGGFKGGRGGRSLRKDVK